jgi:SAM-dependent methyltransferase
MLEASRERILRELPDAATVLDVGGWAKPWHRADWVIDLMPYETRGLYGGDGDSGAAERFDEGRWVQRDICDHEPWPFAGDQFDFVVCSHTLEDVRDPVRVCDEIQRVGRAGYIEVPSRLEEQTFGIEGPWAGWGHHHWLIDIGPAEITFVFKHGVVHGRRDEQFPAGFSDSLTAEERVQTLWWEGGFDSRERVMIGPEEIDRYLAEFVAEEMSRRPRRRRRLFR